MVRHAQREEGRDLAALLAESDDEADMPGSAPGEGGAWPGGEASTEDGLRERTGQTGAGVKGNGPAREQAGTRAHRVMVRFNQSEWDMLRTRQARTGTAELATYIRGIVLTGRSSSADPATPEPAEPAGHERSRRVYVHLNAQEWATLEERRARLGMSELGAYVRRAALARRPLPYVPEVNRQGWVELIGHLETLDELARHLRGLPRPPARGGLGGLLGGRGGLEERLERVSTELGAVHEAIQALRRDMLGTK